MRIIVEHGDDYESYHNATTDEDWARNSLKILTNRFNQGYWYHETQNYHLFDELKRIVEEQDTSFVTYKSGRKEPKAWKILDDRSDYEDERVELVEVEE